jgi:hypothetical protein
MAHVSPAGPRFADTVFCASCARNLAQEPLRFADDVLISFTRHISRRYCAVVRNACGHATRRTCSVYQPSARRGPLSAIVGAQLLGVVRQKSYALPRRRGRYGTIALGHCSINRGGTTCQSYLQSQRKPQSLSQSQRKPQRHPQSLLQSRSRSQPQSQRQPRRHLQSQRQPRRHLQSQRQPQSLSQSRLRSQPANQAKRASDQSRNVLTAHGQHTSRHGVPLSALPVPWHTWQTFLPHAEPGIHVPQPVSWQARSSPTPPPPHLPTRRGPRSPSVGARLLASIPADSACTRRFASHTRAVRVYWEAMSSTRGVSQVET